MQKKNLIIVRAGKRSLHPHWVEPGSERSFDVLVSPYEEEASRGPEIEGVTYAEVMTEPKWHSLHKLLQQWRGWEEYDYIMLADDDVFARQDVFEAFFKLCRQSDASLAQPALSEYSYFSHLITVRNRSFSARKVTYVEVMLPCFRVDVLRDLLHTFTESKTGLGWGLDALWAKRLNYEGLYIMDDTAVHHTMPVGQRYPEMRQTLLDEQQAIFDKFDCQAMFKTLVGYKVRGNMAHTHPAFLHILLRGFETVLDTNPKLITNFFILQRQELPEPTLPVAQA